MNFIKTLSGALSRLDILVMDKVASSCLVRLQSV